MSVPHLRVYRGDSTPDASRTWAILLSSYMSGATEGNRLGTAGYSYDFVARLFAPLLERMGKVVEIHNPGAELSAAAEEARQQGLKPVQVCFRPFHDACLTSSAHNVVVPAWEFPDIPNVDFDGNPQNNWVETANHCSLVLVGGPFTAKALDLAGVKTPIRIVPVPTPETYFQMPRWQSDYRATLDCKPYIFPGPDASVGECQPNGGQALSAVRWPREAIRVLALQAYRHVLKPCLPRKIAPVAAAVLRAGVAAWQDQTLPYRCSHGLTLGGVVYTSIFNPNDGRKNWEDMVTAFLYALRDCEDATLVLKLITSNRQAIGRVLAFYRRLDVAHRCRLVVIPDFLSEEDMLRLTQATTFYLTTTRAEGNCLPLMNYLAAGRPCVSPSHTAIADYFDSQVGFVVESHAEPCAWPQDSRLRWRSSWQRLVWPSLVEQIQRSYRMAKAGQNAYESMGAAARERMTRWSHPDAVWPQLRSALELLASDSLPKTEIVEPSRPASQPVEPATIPIETSRVGAAQRRASNSHFGPSTGTAPLRAVVSLLNLRPGKIGGTETYLRQLIARLPNADRRHEIVLLMDRDLAAEDVFPGMQRAVVDLSARQVWHARALEAFSPYRARTVEKALEQLRPDVVFFPQQSIFPKNVAAPCVLVVHDLYHLFLPQYLDRVQRLFRQRCYASSVSRADRIIAISEFTKKTILQHYCVAPESIDVIPHGWDPVDCDVVEDAAEVAGNYLYYPAITRPHKNHRALFESLAALRAQGRFDGQLILSGMQTPDWKTLCKQIRKLNLDDTVRHVGYVPYQRVRQLYRGAQCIVFPSTFEGFGLPVMEACAAGKKLLVSRLEVFGELGVPERFQIDFSDPEQLYAGLQEPGITVLEKRPWTWEESAAATMTLLATAAGWQVSKQSAARAA